MATLTDNKPRISSNIKPVFYPPRPGEKYFTTGSPTLQRPLHKQGQHTHIRTNRTVSLPHPALAAHRRGAQGALGGGTPRTPRRHPVLELVHLRDVLLVHRAIAAEGVVGLTREGKV